MFIILHLIPTLEGGGAERQLAMLAVEQARCGFDVHVGIRRGGVHLHYLENTFVKVHFLGDHRGINPLLLLNIHSLIREIQPTLMHTWLPQMDVLGGLASLWNSIPWIFSERASGLLHHRWNMQNFMRFHLAKLTSAIVANSYGGASYWRSKLLVNQKVFQISNAVDVASIQKYKSLAIENEVSSKEISEILVVGRLAPEKAIEIIIAAVFLIHERQDFHVSIIGEGPLRDQLQEQVEIAGLAKHITLIAYKPDWWGLLKTASALISMSRHEGQPNVVLESIAAFCPLIVSDISAHREFLDEDSAIFVPIDNPRLLANAIIELLEHSSSAVQRAKRASEAVSKLTIKSTADSYKAIYQKVINKSLN